MRKLSPRWVSLTKYQINKHVRLYLQNLTECNMVLDVGSGSTLPFRGYLACRKMIGIDLFDPSDVQGDIAALPFDENTFDLVLCTEVLEHVPEPEKALIEIARVLASGGMAIITVPFIWGEHDYVDYRRWTELGLKQLIRNSGLHLVRLDRRGGIFSVIGTVIFKIPDQVMMADDTRFRFRRIFRLMWSACLLPIPWLSSWLDFLDGKQTYTLGFSLLVVKD